MVKLCLMVSHGYHPYGAELGFGRFSKECQTLWPNHGPKHELPRLDSFNPRPHQEPWTPISGFPESIKFVEIESTIKKPVLIDAQESNPISTLFSFGIAEKCSKHDKIMKHLMSDFNDVKQGEVDLSMISQLIGLQALIARDNNQNISSMDYGPSIIKGTEAQHSIIYPTTEFNDEGPLFDIVGDMICKSKITVNPDGRVSFTGTGAELKDILSVVVEYYLANNSTKWKKQTVLIPHFNSETIATVQDPTMVLENVKYAPLKSPKKVKLKPSAKTKLNKKARERDLYERNYFHACETLLSIIVDKNRNKKKSIFSLKKSGPELPHLLTQLSASIAGTGIAILFSIVCKAGFTRVPFCSTKIFNTGIGFALVWLSCGMNRLRDTVVNISKSSGKINLKEEEMTRKLDTCVHDLFFRAATLMAVMVLRLA